MRPILLLGLLAAGCTTGPAITPMPSAPGVFIISRESPTQYPPADRLAEQVLAEARAHCRAQGEHLDAEVIDAQASKGWNMTGNVPVYRMRFVCVQAANVSPR